MPVSSAVGAESGRRTCGRCGWSTRAPLASDPVALGSVDARPDVPTDADFGANRTENNANDQGW